MNSLGLIHSISMEELKFQPGLADEGQGSNHLISNRGMDRRIKVSNRASPIIIPSILATLFPMAQFLEEQTPPVGGRKPITWVKFSTRQSFLIRSFWDERRIDDFRLTIDDLSAGIRGSTGV